MTAEDRSIANRNSAEFRVYLDELWRRLRLRSKRSAGIPAGRARLVRMAVRGGCVLESSLRSTGLSSQDVALQLGLPVNQVRFLELGVVARNELSERSLRDYARTVGRPELCEELRQRFEA